MIQTSTLDYIGNNFMYFRLHTSTKQINYLKLVYDLLSPVFMSHLIKRKLYFYCNNMCILKFSKVGIVYLSILKLSSNSSQ